MKIVVNSNKCPQNHPCPVIRFCPVQAISQEGYGLPSIDNSVCVSCMKCFRFCPTGAFESVK